MTLEHFIHRRSSRAPKHYMVGAIGGVTVSALGIAFADAGRRSRARDRLTSTVRHTSDDLDRARRNVQNRVRGALATAGSMMHPDTPSDEKLVARVRAALGHVTSHAQALGVEAHDGRIALSGPILRPETRRILRAVRKVKGVHGVDSCFEEHETAEGIPSLQGAPRRQRGARFAPALGGGVGLIGAAALVKRVAHARRKHRTHRKLVAAGIAAVGSALVLRAMLTKRFEAAAPLPELSEATEARELEGLASAVEVETVTPIPEDAIPTHG